VAGSNWKITSSKLENYIGTVYIKGDAVTDDSVRLTVNISGDLVYEVYSGGIWSENTVSLSVEDIRKLNGIQPTGLLEGSVISATVPGTTIDWTSGKGQVVNYADPENPIVTEVTWDAVSGYTPTNLATDGTTIFGYDSAGSLVEVLTTAVTIQDSHDYIFFGLVTHISSQVIEVLSSPGNLGYDGIGSYRDFINLIIGPANIEGNVYSANGANLNIDVIGGNAFIIGANFRNNPTISDSIALNSVVGITFQKLYRSADPSLIMLKDGASTTDIDPTQYDDGSGTLQSVTAGYWTIQRIFRGRTGGTNVSYGQQEFATKALALEALGAESFTEKDPLPFELFRCSLVVSESATDLSDTAEAEFFDQSSFRIGGARSSSASIPGVTNPGGSDGAVQVNDGGTFGGTSNISYSGTSLDFDDSTSIKMGTDDDFSVVHNGINAIFSNSTGDVFIDNTDPSGSFIFRLLGVFPATTRFDIRDENSADIFSVLGTGVVKLQDNIPLRFGSGDDFTIIHNETDTLVVSNTGDMEFYNTDATGLIYFTLGTDTADTSFQVRDNSSVPLFEVFGDGSLSIGIDPTISINTEGNVDFKNSISTPYLGSGQLQNLLRWSEDTTNVVWTDTPSVLAITADQVLAPDGTMTADEWAFSAFVGTGVLQTVVLTNGATYTLSFWARALTTARNIRFDLGDGAVEDVNVEVTDDLQRYSVEIVAGNNDVFYVKNNIATAGTIYVWGFQINEGVERLPYAKTEATLINAAGSEAGTVVNGNEIVNGFVGIGTSTPNSELQLSNAVANRKIVLYEGSNNDHQFYGFGLQSGELRYQVQLPTTDHVFYAGTSPTTSDELIRITGDGNVGIGTSTPNAELQFSNNLFPRKIVMYSTANNDHQFTGFGNAGGIRYQITSTAGAHYFNAGTSDTTSDQLMRITGTGFVGIGNSDPRAPLQFETSIANKKIVLWGTGDSDHEFFGFGVSGISLRYQVNSPDSDHTFYAATGPTTSDELMRITGDGKVGIGTSTPNAPLEFAQGDAFRKIVLSGVDNNNEFYGFGVNSGRLLYQVNSITADHVFFAATSFGSSHELMRITGDQKVGIGGIDPISTLHVYEDTAFTGELSGITIEQDGTGDAAIHLVRTANQRWNLGIDGSDSNKFKIAPGIDIGTDTSITIQHTNTYVGIGNSDPQAPLHFEQATASRKIVLWSGPSNDNQFYGFGVNGGSLRYQVDDVIADHVFYAGTSSTTSDELMRILGSGDVSIGTVGSGGRFTFIRSTDDSSLNIYSGSATGSASTIFHNSASAITADIIYNETLNNFSISTEAGVDLILATGAGANIGVNKPLPVSTLHISEGTTTSDSTTGTTFEQIGLGSAVTHYVRTNTGTVFSSGIDEDDVYKISNDYALGINTDIAINTESNIDFKNTIATPYGGFGRLQNLLKWSEDTTNAVWTDNPSIVVKTANTTLAPDGTLNADTWAFTGTNGIATRQFFTIAEGSTYTVSFWARALVSTRLVRFDLGDGSVEDIYVNVTDDLQRYSGQFVAGAQNWLDITNVTLSSGTIYVWGFQVNEGTELLPYTRTEAVQVHGTGPESGLAVNHSAIFSTIAAPNYSEGTVFYDDGDKALSYYNEDSNVTVGIGRDLLVRVQNDQGTTISSGEAVYINGSASGLPTVRLARSDSLATSQVAGIVNETLILDGEIGYISAFGLIEFLNTSSWLVGDQLYLSSTVAGALTKFAPASPNHIVSVAHTVTSDLIVGSIQVHTPERIVSDGLKRLSFAATTTTGTLGQSGIYAYTATGAPVTLTLSTLTLALGSLTEVVEFIVIDEAGGCGTNTLTLDTEGTAKINGLDTYLLDTDNASVTMYTNGVNYFII